MKQNCLVLIMFFFLCWLNIFYANSVLKLNIVEERPADVHTCCYTEKFYTDTTVIYYDPDYWRLLNDDERELTKMVLNKCRSIQYFVWLRKSNSNRCSISVLLLITSINNADCVAYDVIYWHISLKSNTFKQSVCIN